MGEAVTRRKQRVKRMLVAEGGGCCAVCGYDRSVVNLGFHHVDPAMKSFGLSMQTTKALSAYREEMKKCVLVCSNCHGEIEASVIESPQAGAWFTPSNRRVVLNGVMRVSAKADYAVRALVEMAAAQASESQPAKGETLARAQQIPLRFLENILGELRAQGLVQSRRGSDGGYWLLRPAERITIAEIIRAVEGPLATVRGEAADELDYPGQAAPLRDVWLALRANIRDLLESVTLADVVANRLPEQVSTGLGRSKRELRTSAPPVTDRAGA